MDTVITQDEALELIREIVIEAGSKTDAADQLGISKQYLNDILFERRAISDNVAHALGYRRIIRFEPIDEDE